MKGFKSYGNKRIAVPLHKGFTCVVGPNGSGKSNLFDAISFVLGRMSAKSMRAGSIADLVFAGTEKHKPAEYADVSIFFDNEDGSFPIDKKEVIISRKVDKSGKGVYRVNNKRETRSYVVDLLNSVGLTPDGYNMIAQGDITRFIKMSSFERRAIIEEISGIQEFDEKKEKGLRELQKAEENIARVDLVVKEVASQLNRLENEKNDALRYQYLRDEIAKDKGKLIYGELDECTSQRLEIEQTIADKQETIERLTAEAEDLHEKIAQQEERSKEIESEIEEKREDEYLAISREVARLSSQLDTLNARKEMKGSSLASARSKIDQLNTTLSSNEEKIGELNAEIGQLQGELSELDAEIGEKERTYASLIDSLEETSNKFFEYKEEADGMEDHIAGLKDQEYSLRNNLTSLKERESATNERVESLQADLSDLGIDEIESTLAETQRTLEEKQQERTQLDIGRLRERERELSSHLDAIERKLISLRNAITELQSQMGKKQESRDVQGRNMNATDEVLRLKETGEVEGIIGKVSDLGTTSKEYAVALEVAAGARMKDIVVEDSDVARSCISILKKKKLGRVTFIPLAEISPRFSPERYRDNLEKDGAIDFAINLVSFKEEHRKAFEFVFSNTLIIRDIDVSRSLSRQRMVTLDGDIIEASGIMTGGYWRPRRYLESFETKEDEEELARLINEKEGFEKQRSSLREDLASLRDDIENASQTDARLSAEISGARKSISELQRSLDSKRSRKESIESSLAKARRALDDINERTTTFEHELEQVEEQLREARERKEALDAKVEEYRSESVERSQQLADELTAKRHEREELVSSIYSRESQRDTLASRNESISGEVSSLARDVETLEAELSSIEDEIEAVELDLEEKRDEESALSSVLQDIKDQRDTLRTSLSSNRDRREKVLGRSAKAEADIKALEVKKDGLDEQIRELEEESVSYERPKEAVDDLKELRFKIGRMEKEKEELEPINMRAIEEYDEVESRYLLLSSKRDKLLEEKTSILRFIDEVETKKRDVFMQAFDLVSKNFTEIFDQLSPQGEGNLVLEDDEDPFSGGLFIEARPAGKELVRTESMSGGEKALTALAFVFAIQQYKPAPFYILDEIDAHLDDDNVRKVSELIKHSCESSQFIVVTHRDAMMARADRLFGTSLQKDKISRIVSVELEQVAELGDMQRYGVAEA